MYTVRLVHRTEQWYGYSCIAECVPKNALKAAYKRQGPETLICHGNDKPSCMSNSA